MPSSRSSARTRRLRARPRPGSSLRLPQRPRSCPHARPFPRDRRAGAHVGKRWWTRTRLPPRATKRCSPAGPSTRWSASGTAFETARLPVTLRFKQRKHRRSICRRTGPSSRWLSRASATVCSSRDAAVRGPARATCSSACRSTGRAAAKARRRSCTSTQRWASCVTSSRRATRPRTTQRTCRALTHARSGGRTGGRLTSGCVSCSSQSSSDGLARSR